MRPTNLHYRNPKEHTPDARLTTVTCYGFNTDMSGKKNNVWRKKGTSMSK